METFKKLPSGNWNLRKYDYTDANGKKHYKSFTGATKTEIRQAVNRWQNTRGTVSAAVTVAEAVRGYIDIKQDVLSPSTVRSYEGIYNNYIKDEQIGRIDVAALTTMQVQRWVSRLSVKDLSAKTIRNAYGLFLSAVGMYMPDLRLKVTLPQKEQPDLHCPDDKEVQQLLDYVRSKGDQVMEFAILAAAFIPARRGEICALTYNDIDGNLITINKSMVKHSDCTWSIKPPKTAGGYRTVEVPDMVINAIPRGSGRIVPWEPDYLTGKFIKYIKASGVTPFRFHDLRHYGASMLLTVMSARYVQDRGGWSSSYTMNRVYNNVIDLEKQRQTKKAIKMFEKKTNVKRR